MDDTIKISPTSLKAKPTDSESCKVAEVGNTKAGDQKDAKKLSPPEISEIMRPKTNDDVQRAIEGLKDIPDEELQEFLDDEDFMEGLDVVDAWEGEEERRLDKKIEIHSKEKERRRTPRDCNRIREHRSPNHRENMRRDERKREESRRDPSKSTKDIERDKIRTLRDSEIKILAEKKKAIKSLLDSDNVVPPGTEMEAIETIVEKQESNKPVITRSRRSRERRRSVNCRKGSPSRRRSTDRGRRSPHRHWSPIVISPEHHRSKNQLSPSSHRSLIRLSPSSRRSPLRLSPPILSPDRRRSLLRLSPTHPRRLSCERRISAEAKRRRRRMEAHERHVGRRSRSRDRRRSRSADRHRRRSTRSPGIRRGSPRWRSRSGSRQRSPLRRTRKRSPFINEIRRQFREEGNHQTAPLSNLQFMHSSPIGGMPPMGPPMYTPEQEQVPYMQHHQPGLQAMMAQGAPSGFMNFEPVHPHMPPSMTYDPMIPQPLLQSEFTSGPVMYGQPNPGPVRPPLLPLPVPSPQPVPAPVQVMEQGPLMYSQPHRTVPPPPTLTQQQMEMAKQRSITPHSRSTRSITPRGYKRERRSPSPYNGTSTSHESRLKTPEPPVISNSKATFGKTSLSSLLEASVSAKDSIGPPILYPGFKPEILQQCENALRDLPVEDPRLKMTGRFFFDPKKEDKSNEHEERSSNSILLRKGRNKIFWDEEEERHSQMTVKSSIHMHQKICQTDDVQTEHKHVQATVTTVDFGVQVDPYDLQKSTKEDKRPIMDRLDWNMRETFDYAPKPREADDLRWSLSNSQKRTWSRGVSPSRESESRGLSRESTSSNDYLRTPTVCAPTCRRDEFPSHRRPTLRDHYTHDSFPSSYRQEIEDNQDHFLDNRSDHSRGESPMVIDDSPEDIEEEPEVFSRSTERIMHTKIQRGKSIPPFKGRGAPRGSSRPFRGGRGSCRGKF
ncbi:serine/arginine repetitive matrix protein 1-like [Athalia rosae]|uniref:serine/arginine repetitive matrix protein 1-like n=1 Tax=Athalia rosae TaxID=37344 RepID=UPI0020339084|nr:serine/arginine repetitive matrix protein 1-like [Athalia rosae]XP_020708023.2 serine/arginine repetitive matrix protein 1-like [Athalia rosae]